MKKVRSLLLYTFWGFIALSVLMAFAFETDLLPAGVGAEEKSLDFVLLSVMELVTICLIPLALRLFKFSGIRRRLLTGTEDDRAQQLLRWGVSRMMLLCVPMFINTLSYYWFLNVAYGYMAIIGLLCLVFVYPSLQRCHDEISDE